MERDDERYIARAIDLARRARHTSPNPKVGAVVVRDGDVLSEGFHARAGAAHAELAALQDVDARGATMYVSLEPCVHHGRTPPCVDAIVDAGIARVVAAMEDPDRRMRGAGFEALRRRGIDVTVGALEDEARALNRAFVHQRTTGYPLMTLKLALSLDGRIAARDLSARWITGVEARRAVHARRVEADAVMVGAGTVVADDPKLTVRDVDADRQPARLIVDARGRVAPTAAVFAADAEVVVATTDDAPHERKTEWKESGAEVVTLPATSLGVDLRALVAYGADRGWLEIYCEGGAALATSLLRDDLVDRLELVHGPLLLGTGGPGIGDLGVASMSQAKRMRLNEVRTLGDDVLAVYERSAR